MKKKIEELLSEKEKISYGQIAKELNAPLIHILRESSAVKKYNVEKLDELFEIFRGWEKVLLLVTTSNFILELKDKFPKGEYGHGYLNFHDSNSVIGGHLNASNIKEVFIVKDFMFGKVSCSIKFYDEDEKEIFSVYVPRDENKELIKECLDSFNNL